MESFWLKSIRATRLTPFLGNFCVFTVTLAKMQGKSLQKLQKAKGAMFKLFE